jgi:hypothetical protein
VAGGGWLGFHLVYHGDRDRVLAELVRPLAASLAAEGVVSRFFCVRYAVGGPHVRLRLQARGGRAALAAARVRAAAAGFLLRAPSPEPLDDERVHRVNRNVIPSDPFATDADDVVLPDNTLLEVPVRFEVQRYGGPAWVGHSVDLFVVSTVQALDFVHAHAGVPAGRRTAGLLRLLLRQAWGHAEGPEAFAALADYADRMFGPALPARTAAAEEAFARSRDALCALVRAELQGLAAGADPPPLADAACALAGAISGAPAEDRESIGISQMHMTANRLGLSNPDEVYLSRLLLRAAEAVSRDDAPLWRAAWDARRRRAEGGPSLRALVRRTVAEFARAATAAESFAA